MYHKPYSVERRDDGDIYYVSGRGLQNPACTAGQP
jgi:hypothetical protein